MNAKPTEEIGRLLFKTTWRYSFLQILAVIIFGPGLIMMIYAMVYQLFTIQNMKLPRIVVTVIPIIVGIYGLKFFIIDTVIRWYKIYFTVELFEDRLVGYNLWGKRTELKFNDITRVKNHKSLVSRGKYSTSFIDRSGNIHDINGNIDYCGFIHDYIIRRVNPDVVDVEWVKKVRNRQEMWSYTRRSPFDTYYYPKYLDWLHEQVLKQKEELIQEGILKPNVLYGDDYRDKLGKKVDK